MLCPICKQRRVRPTDPDFPFCSERCRILDLGNWASGSYKVSVPLPDADSFEADTEPGLAPEPPAR